MKIAFLSLSASENHGWGNITLNLCDYFYNNYINFDLFLPSNHNLVHRPWQSQIKYLMPKNALDFKSKRCLLLLLQNVSFFKEYDIIHILDGYAFSLLALKSSYLFGSRLVQGIQGTYGVIPFEKKISSFLFKRVLKKCSVFVGPSLFSTREAQKYCLEFNLSQKTQIIPNGVDFNRFQTFNQRKYEGLDFVGIGEIKARKGFDLVIKALPKVLEKFPRARYKIVGPGDTSQLLKLCQKLNIENSVVFTGAKSGQDLVNELQNSYAYIHAPRNIDNNFEGFGIVYIEANACGLPALGSISGGVPDAIIHEKTGLLFSENSIEEISRSMLRVIEDKTLYDSMRRNAIDWARTHDWQEIGKKYIALYHSVLGVSQM